MSKNILAVDTSSRVLSVALKSKTGQVFESNSQGEPAHSEQLIAVIQKGLKRLRLKKEQIEVLLWGLGPGSFTGLRIGLSVLKGLHFGLERKSLGASSMDLIALGCRSLSNEVVVCINARRQRIYTAIYRFNNGEIKKVLRDSVLSFDQLIGTLKTGTAVTGDAIEEYGPRIKDQMGEEVTFLQPKFWYPKASFLFDLY